MESKNYKKDFVERTIKILNELDGNYTFSALMLSTFALIILPAEKNLKAFQGLKIEDFTQNYFTLRLFNPIKSDKEMIKYAKVNFYWFLKKVRNGLAHFNIEVVNSEGELKYG
jgi:hypothetical protein